MASVNTFGGRFCRRKQQVTRQRTAFAQDVAWQGAILVALYPAALLSILIQSMAVLFFLKFLPSFAVIAYLCTQCLFLAGMQRNFRFTKTGDSQTMIAR